MLTAPIPANITHAFSCPHLFHPTLEHTAILTYNSITVYLTNLPTVKWTGFLKQAYGGIFCLASRIISQIPETKKEENKESSRFSKEEVVPGGRESGLLSLMLFS